MKFKKKKKQGKKIEEELKNDLVFEFKVFQKGIKNPVEFFEKLGFVHIE